MTRLEQSEWRANMDGSLSIMSSTRAPGKQVWEFFVPMFLTMKHPIITVEGHGWDELSSGWSSGRAD